MQEKQSFVESAGVRLSVRERGEPGNRPLVLVHGYPDNSAVWDAVVAALAADDPRRHVVRYDVRGMGESSAPEDSGGYRLEHLAADLAAVVRAVSPDHPVHLVGHDWGSIQSWEAVGDPRCRHLFASFTTLSGPCLGHLEGWWRRNLTPRGLPGLLNQGLHSAYIGLFSAPGLPELLWRSSMLRSWFRAERGDAVRGLELYRQNIGRGTSAPHRTDLPVQQLVLTRDNYVLPTMLTSADPWCDRLWRYRLSAGHWAPRTHPEAVARRITDFAEYATSSGSSRDWEAVRVRQRRSSG